MFNKQIRVLFAIAILGMMSLSGLLQGIPVAQATSGITIDSPADGAVVGSGKIRISGTYSGLYDIKLFINGSRQVDVLAHDPNGTHTGTWHYDLDTSIYSGKVQIRARGLDVTTRYGVWSADMHIQVNNSSAIAPIVTIESPLEGISLTGVVPVKVAVQSVAAIARVEVRTNGGSWQAAAYNGQHYVYDWDTSSIGDKTSSIEARAFTIDEVRGRSLTTYARVGAGTNETVIVKSQDRAMWIWEGASYNILLNPGSRDVLLEMAKDTATFDSDPVNVLYFAVGPFAGLDIMEDRPDILRDFIAWAHANGFEVHACIAGGTSPPYMGAYRQFHDVAIRHFEQVLNYNISSAPGERFDGVNVDIEPYISPDFADESKFLQVEYLELTEKMIERRNATGLNLPVGPAIPRWYDSSDRAKDIEFNGQTKWLSEHIQDMVDYISIMNYRDQAEGSPGLIAQAQGEIHYANLIGKPNSVIIGVETLDIANSGDPETITFREEGRTYMEAELDKVYAAFGNEPSFGGIAMHHYDSIRWLSSHWGPDGVLWLPPDDNEPPSAVTRDPVAQAVDYQTIAISYGRAYDNSEVENYIIYRSTNPNFTASAIHAVGTSRTLSYRDIGLLPSTTYYYQVAAVDVRGNIGPVSLETSATTGATSLKPMIVSANKVERGAGNAQATLQVSDFLTGELLTADVSGRFTYAGGRFFDGNTGGNQVSFSSESIPDGYLIGFMPRRVVASGYYWAQAYDTPRVANVYPRMRLQSLTTSEGDLSTPFSSEQAHYVMQVAEDVTSIRLTPTAELSTTAIKVNGMPVASGTPSQAIPLGVGDRVITIQTIAPDASMDSYTITVRRPAPVDNVFVAVEDAYVHQNQPSTNFGSLPYLNVLDILNADGGGDHLTYMKFDLTNYVLPVESVTLHVYAAYSVDKQVKIDAIGYPDDNWSESTIVFNNRPLQNPQPLGQLVVKEAGWYTLDITPFVQSQTGPGGDQKVTVRLIINDIPNSSGTLVQFHSRENATNQPYLLVNPSSDATLSQLRLSQGMLQPVFDPIQQHYSAVVTSRVDHLTVIPTVAESHATVKVNGQRVASGIPSQEITLNASLPTPIEVEVTAQDGTMLTYYIQVTKVLSNNADLQSLSVIGGQLQQSFDPNVTVYTGSVLSQMDSIQIHAVASDPEAYLWVNEQPVYDGALSQPISLTYGANDIVIRVEATDGTHKQFHLSVARPVPPSLKALQLLELSGVTLQPAFDAETYAYTANVGSQVTETTVQAIAVDPLAQIHLNGNDITGQSFTIPLQTGENVLLIEVIAQDQSVLSYEITLHRQAPSSQWHWIPDDREPSDSLQHVVHPDHLVLLPQAELTQIDGQMVGKVRLTTEALQRVLADADLSTIQHIVMEVTEAEQVNEWQLEMEPTSLALLAEAKLALLLRGPGWSVSIPLDTLESVTSEHATIYFRFKPMTEAAAQTSLLKRLAASELVLSQTRGNEPNTVGVPWLIETNLDGGPMLLRLALPESEWENKQNHLNQSPAYGVYIEHSAGGVGFQRGTVVYEGQSAAIEIVVDQFSTFTIVKLPPKLQAYITGYQDGTFRPDHSISRAELASLLDRLSGQATPFEPAADSIPLWRDVQGHWAASAITRWAREGVFQGYPTQSFMPDRMVTRAELAAVLIRWQQPSVSKSAVHGLLDIGGHWAEKMIETGYTLGWWQGYHDHTFRPNQFVTRAEAVAVLNRVTGRKAVTAPTELPWSDVRADHPFAADIWIASFGDMD